MYVVSCKDSNEIRIYRSCITRSKAASPEYEFCLIKRKRKKQKNKIKKLKKAALSLFDKEKYKTLPWKRCVCGTIAKFGSYMQNMIKP